MRSLAPWLLALALLPLAGCASLEPEWLAEARAREAEPLPPQEIRSSDGFLRARVEARSLAPIERQGDLYLARLDVGTEAPIDCLLYREALDGAGSLAGLSRSTFDTISQEFGAVDTTRIEQVDAGALGGSPFLAASWLYRIRSGDSFQVGGVKHLIARTQGRTVYCLHNELGYAQTFRRVVRGLVESIQYREAAEPRPYYSQISTLTIGDMAVGFEYATLTRDDEGDTRVDLRTSLAIPVSRDTLQASDSFTVEFAEPSGRLINQLLVETENGEVVTFLKLDPRARGLWQVEGTFQTKVISAEIQTEQEPTTWLGEALTLRRALAKRGVGSELTLVRWVPQADPLRLVDQKLSIRSQLSEERYGARLALAGVEADLVVDPRGSVAEASIDMGFGNIEVERVYQGGSF